MTPPSLIPKKRGNKYGAKRTVVDGLTFDSAGEASRWFDLVNLQRGGLICNLERQKKYTLVDKIGKQRAATYTADFDYFDIAKNAFVTEDFKGVVTAEFKLKAKLFRARYGREILITGARP